MSQSAEHTTTIDGIGFESKMLDPWIANEILHDLFHIVGPSIGDVMAGIADGKESAEDLEKRAQGLAKEIDPMDQKVNGAMLSSAVTGLFDRMTATQTRDIMEKLAGVTLLTAGGRLSDTFSIVFMGKLGTMYKWAGWSLGVQFGNFFGSMPAAIAWFSQRAAMAKAAAAAAKVAAQAAEATA